MNSPMDIWETKTIEEILDIRSGSVNPSKHPDEIFELYSMPAYDAGMAPETLPGSEIGSSKTLIENGDCLLSKLNPRIPRVWVINSDTERRKICSTDFVVLVDKKRPNGECWFEGEFLRYALLSDVFRSQVVHDVQGATGSRQRLRRQNVKAAQIPVPPLEEQRRIVARIEELFERLNEARRLRLAADEEAERLILDQRIINS